MSAAASNEPAVANDADNNEYAATFDKDKFEKMDPRQLHDELKLSHSKFSRACDQLLLIDDRVKQIEVRYQRAVKRKKESSRYAQRLNLSIMTGLKCVMYEYAMRMAAQVEGIRKIAEKYSDLEDDYFYTDDDDSDEDESDNNDDSQDNDENSDSNNYSNNSSSDQPMDSS